ncbi:MAG: hypothetical protein WC843_04220 [Candidatus Gracilibacteria bacterium]
MMDLSIDFGASTIDVIYWEGLIERKFLCIKSFERAEFFGDHDLKKFFERAEINLKKIEKIFVTGGRSRLYPDKIGGVLLVKISEIEAIGRGGYYMWKTDEAFGKRQKSITQNFLVVSMGTGTCMVQVEVDEKGYVKSQHVGGTGVGGGTFMGLSKLLLAEKDPQKLQKLFKNGNKDKVDLSVKDIIGSGIGLVPADATASNLGKLAREVDFSDADLASGIENLIGQTIGILAVFAAKASGSSCILLTGKLTRMKSIVRIIQKIGGIYQVPIFLPTDAAYVGSFGAGFFG